MQMQNFSVNDGEGIRTNIFLPGCPLRCAWCANPEGQTMHNAMTRQVCIDEIIKEARHQRIFYRFSGGGVTLSGGEPTFQLDFFKELTERLYNEGFSIAVETCGEFDFDEVKDALAKTDLIFIDLKHIDSERHRHFTGVGNERILANIERISRLGPRTVVRIPSIVGVNCDDESMRGAFSFIAEHAPSASLELLPFHKFGEMKYKQLGMDMKWDGFSRPSDEDLKRYEDMARSMGINVVSYK